MKLRDLNPETVKAAIEDFYDQTSEHVEAIAKTVGNERMSIPRTPRKMGTYQFPYFFAADIDQLARFALGGLQMARKFVLDLCDATEDALFRSAAGAKVEPPRDWYDTPLGFIVRAARARADLRKEGGPVLDADAVRALSGGASDSVLKKAGLLKKGGDPQDKVREFLEQRGQPV